MKDEDVVQIVYDVSAGGWRPACNGSFDMNLLLKKANAKAHLVGCGWPQNQAKNYLESFDEQTLVYGADMRPGKPSVFIDPDTDRRMVNLWVPPTLVPKPGPFPTIQSVLEHVTRGDIEGQRWLVHKLAQKYQDQNLVSKVAVVLSTTQGAGKGFLFRVMAEILGTQNCATVTQSEIEGRYFLRYAHMLLLLGDEITSSENIRDISQKLKVLIDGGTIEAEQKYERSVPVRSRMMWMFASNDPVSPLVLEGSDRRYTFFSNFEAVNPAYTATLNACFEKDRVTPTPAFLEEIAGFAAHLQAIEVDVPFVSRPYKNDAREQLIENNRPSHEMFCREVDEIGFDALKDSYVGKSVFFSSGPTSDTEWDFGPDGIAFNALYQVYKTYCKETGQFPLRANKFGGAIKNHLPKWEHVRKWTKAKRQVWCYVVPRKPKHEVKE